jgi:hypothetical protein
VQCAGCRALVLVPGDSGVPAPPSTALTRKQWSRRFVGIFVVFIPLLLAALAGAGYMTYQKWFANKVSVYVDNTGDQPLSVTLDHGATTTVAPGTFALIKCKDGSHHIQAKQGEIVVFDETKEFSAGTEDKPAKYLLNPDATGRYHSHTVQYGMAIMPWGLSNLRPVVDRLTPLMANQADLFPRMNEDAIKNEIFWACSHGDINLVKPTVWQDISQFDIVLERAPKQIKGDLLDKQVVFARLSKADYDSITLIRSNEKMTKPELANAVRAMTHILDAEMPR